MPDHDAFAGTDEAWAATGNAYRAVELNSFMRVVDPVAGLDVLHLATGGGPDRPHAVGGRRRVRETLADRSDMARELGPYLANPSCVVLSAVKPADAAR